MNVSTPSLSARDLILTLIDSASRRTLSARYFVAAGDLFSMDQSSVRVSLARLVKDGSLRQSGRGQYQLGSRGGTLHRLVRNWAKVESSVKPWTGNWVSVLTAHLPRSDKTSLRGRERALRLFGFAQPQLGLWVRPDNLQLELAPLRDALVDLGLEAQALTCCISQLAPHNAVDYALWDRDSLEQRYRGNLKALAESVNSLTDKTEAEAGRETLLLGRAVTRDILLDPLLPEEMVDVQLRGQMVEAMREYDQLGKVFWRGFEVAHNSAGE